MVQFESENLIRTQNLYYVSTYVSKVSFHNNKKRIIKMTVSKQTENLNL